MSSDASVTELGIDHTCRHEPVEPHPAWSGAGLMRKLDNLRPHQARALSSLRQSIGTGHRRPMVQAPTGAGKTVLAAAIVDGARRKHKKVLFVVPALSLIEQTVEAFYSEGLTEVGVIQAAHRLTDWSQPVQVASVHTLMRRGVPDVDLAIIDEAHLRFRFYGRWFADPEWRARPIIGLSATPWTPGLGKLYDDLIVASTTRELIRDGYLCPFRVYAPSHPDLSSVRIVAGDFEEGGLSAAMNKAPLIADVVQTWLQRAEDRPTLCFAVDRAHAKRLHLEFEAAGVGAAYIDAYTSGAERKDIERRLHAAEVNVVCNVGCLTTGIDWDVRCIILARPTKSEILFVQMIGRGLRTAQGKDDCIILDHSDTHLRLGFVSDIHHEQLDTGRERQSKKRDKPLRLPQECPKCSFLKEAKVIPASFAARAICLASSGVSTMVLLMVRLFIDVIYTVSDFSVRQSELRRTNVRQEKANPPLGDTAYGWIR